VQFLTGSRIAKRSMFEVNRYQFAMSAQGPALPSCVDGSEVARAFFTFAALVGAPMCSAF